MIELRQVLWHLIIGGIGAIMGLLFLHFVYPQIFLLSGVDPYLFLFYPAWFYFVWKLFIVIGMYTLFPIIMYAKLSGCHLQ